MSKSSELSKVVKSYIISCIDNSGYSDDDLITDSEKIKFLADTFQSEYGWHIEQVGQQEALKSWYMGLPTACNIEFRNHLILEIAHKWGSLPENATERQENKILDNWFNLIAVKTGQLFNKHKVF